MSIWLEPNSPCCSANLHTISLFSVFRLLGENQSITFAALRIFPHGLLSLWIRLIKYPWTASMAPKQGESGRNGFCFKSGVTG